MIRIATLAVFGLVGFTLAAFSADESLLPFSMSVTKCSGRARSISGPPIPTWAWTTRSAPCKSATSIGASQERLPQRRSSLQGHQYRGWQAGAGQLGVVSRAERPICSAAVVRRRGKETLRPHALRNARLCRQHPPADPLGHEHRQGLVVALRGRDCHPRRPEGVRTGPDYSASTGTAATAISTPTSTIAAVTSISTRTTTPFPRPKPRCPASSVTTLPDARSPTRWPRANGRSSIMAAGPNRASAAKRPGSTATA